MLRSAAAAMVLIACPAAAEACGMHAAEPGGQDGAAAAAADAAAPINTATNGAEGDAAPLNTVIYGAAAATAPAAARPTQDIDFSRADPWEKQNRRFFRWNEKFDQRVVRPTAMGYEHNTPRRLQQGLRNFLDNLGAPLVFANDVLQLHPVRAAKTTFRFVTNSTLGVAGIFDVATKMGVEGHNNTFGTTLGRYGVPPGPYIFLPILGPSDVRDLTGDIVDGFMDPFTWARYENRVVFNSAKTLAGGLDTRARADVDLRTLLDQSTDPYATLRSVYLQNRQAEIEGELGSQARQLPDFDEPPVVNPPPPASPESQTPQANPEAPKPAETQPDQPHEDTPAAQNGPAFIDVWAGAEDSANNSI
jgi:phospholipid-binding lipoprotein MlaA